MESPMQTVRTCLQLDAVDRHEMHANSEETVSRLAATIQYTTS